MHALGCFSSIPNLPALAGSGSVENCAKLHYQVNGMDNILEKYVGNLPSFISFLEKEWGWEITYSEDGQQLFSRVCQKNISAKVKRSVLRDGQSCIYEISGL